jgi:cellulose synthase (UDP-forming)
VRLRGTPYPEGTRGRLRIDKIGDVEAYVIAQLPEGARLHLLPTEKQREELMLRFYADDNLPGVARVRSAAIIADIARRLSFNTGRS